MVEKTSEKCLGKTTNFLGFKRKKKIMGFLFKLQTKQILFQGQILTDWIENVPGLNP